MELTLGLFGFPAPAGMDPMKKMTEDSWGGIPRTRGDGPPIGRKRSQS